MATKTKERTSTGERLVTRAAIVRTPAGITYDGLPNARNGYLPWQAKYEKNVRLGDLAKVRVNEADLLPCERHQGLAFLDEAALARHVADDERLISELRERIPRLEEEAVRMDQAAANASAADHPLQLDAGALAERDRVYYQKHALDARSDAKTLRAKLAQMGVSE